MKRIDLNEARQRLERGASVEGVLKDAYERHKEFEDIIVIGVTKEKMIEFGYSVDNGTKTIGVLEFVKNDFIEQIANNLIE